MNKIGTALVSSRPSRTRKNTDEKIIETIKRIANKED